MGKLCAIIGGFESTIEIKPRCCSIVRMALIVLSCDCTSRVSSSLHRLEIECDTAICNVSGSHLRAIDRKQFWKLQLSPTFQRNASFGPSTHTRTYILEEALDSQLEVVTQQLAEGEPHSWMLRVQVHVAELVEARTTYIEYHIVTQFWRAWLEAIITTSSTALLELYTYLMLYLDCVRRGYDEAEYVLCDGLERV